MISVPSLHCSWEKKTRKKAEEKNVKRFERELKEAAKKQREVYTPGDVVSHRVWSLFSPGWMQKI